MYKYTEDELTDKIQTFLDKKSQKFPELNRVKPSPERDIPARFRRLPHLTLSFETHKTLWA